MYSSQRIPGLGFGMGDVTLFDYLATHDLRPGARGAVDVVVIPTDVELVDGAREIARYLHRAGLRTSVPLDPRKLGKEIQRSDRSGAKTVVIIGRTDWESGCVTVQDVISGDQRTVPRSGTRLTVANMVAMHNQ